MRQVRPAVAPRSFHLSCNTRSFLITYQVNINISHLLFLLQLQLYLLFSSLLQLLHFFFLFMAFPPVQGGGSLIVAWQVKSKHVLVVGGGEVSYPLHCTALCTA